MKPRGDERHVEELLSCYLLGQVTPAERAEIDRHLPTCGRCRAEYDYVGGALGYLAMLTDDDFKELLHDAESEAASRESTTHVTAGARLAAPRPAMPRPAGKRALAPRPALVRRVTAWRDRPVRQLGRWSAVLAAGAAALVAGMAIGALPHQSPEPLVPVPAGVLTNASDVGSGVSAAIAVTSNGASVVIQVDLQGLRPTTRYQLSLLTTDGGSLLIAEWRAATTDQSLGGTAPVDLHHLRGFTVTVVNGPVVLSGSFGADGSTTPSHAGR